MDSKEGSLEVGEEGGGILQARRGQSFTEEAGRDYSMLLFSQEIEVIVDLDKSSSVW